MKKIILTTTCLLMMGTFVKGQAFEGGKNYFSVGYGTGNFAQSFLKATVEGSGASDMKFVGTGPLFVKFEHAAESKIGYGLSFAYMSNAISYTETNTDSVPYTYSAKLKCTTFNILARVNYHLGDNEHLDPYIGLGVGYRAVKWSYTDTDPKNNSNADEIGFNALPKFPLGADLTFGLRYLFTPNIGIYTEVGLSKAVIQGGLQFKF